MLSLKKVVFIILALLSFTIIVILVYYFVYFKPKSSLNSSRVIYEVTNRIDTYNNPRDLTPNAYLLEGKKFIIVVDEGSWIGIRPVNDEGSLGERAFWVKSVDLQYKQI